MKTKTSKTKKQSLLQASKEFQVGRHSIGWINSSFQDYFGKQSFEARPMPTSQRLLRDMTDAEIESELRPGFCELGDILAFLDQASEEYKDGYANLFYLGSCVVSVVWDAVVRGWFVCAWRRGGAGWGGGFRAFSPAGSALAKDVVPLGDFVSRVEFEEFKRQVGKVLKLDSK